MQQAIALGRIPTCFVWVHGGSTGTLEHRHYRLHHFDVGCLGCEEAPPNTVP
jgi:hypothetical protein